MEDSDWDDENSENHGVSSSSERWSAESDNAASHSQEEAWDSSASSSSSEPEIQQACDLMVEFLLQMLFKGTVSAKAVCTICWWAWKAGCGGYVQRLAYNPTAQTGKFQRHIDKVLGVSTKSPAYTIDLPHYTHGDLIRKLEPVPVEIPHQELLDEIANTPTYEDDLHRCVQSRLMPPSYYSHPTVLESEPDALPPGAVGIFIDGAPFAKKKSFIAVTVFNLITGVRHLVAMLQKHNLCRCGCRGWCTMWKVFEYVRWSFQAMSDGVHPLRRHDHKAWLFGSVQAGLAGVQIAFKFVLLWIKVDWAECSTLGLPTWAHRTFPCFSCFCEKSTMNDIREEFADELPWAEV